MYLGMFVYSTDSPFVLDHIVIENLTHITCKQHKLGNGNWKTLFLKFKVL